MPACILCREADEVTHRLQGTECTGSHGDGEQSRYDGQRGEEGDRYESQHAPGVGQGLKCVILMRTDTSRPQTSATASSCCKMSSNVAKCQQLPPTAADRRQMSRDATRSCCWSPGATNRPQTGHHLTSVALVCSQRGPVRRSMDDRVAHTFTWAGHNFNSNRRDAPFGFGAPEKGGGDCHQDIRRSFRPVFQLLTLVDITRHQRSQRTSTL